MNEFEITFSNGKVMRITAIDTGTLGSITIDGEPFGIPLTGIDIALRPGEPVMVTLHAWARHTDAKIVSAQITNRVRQ